MSETEREQHQADAPLSDDTATVSRDGVHVEKSIQWMDDETFRVQFDVTNTTDEAVHVDVEEQIPAEVSLDDIGFHGDYGWEYWYVEHDSLLAHRVDLQPNEEHPTLYAVRSGGKHDPDIFLGEPVLQVAPLAEDGAPATTASSDDGADSTTTDASMFESDSTRAENDSDPVPVEQSASTSGKQSASTSGTVSTEHHSAPKPYRNKTNGAGTIDAGDEEDRDADGIGHADGAEDNGDETSGGVASRSETRDDYATGAQDTANGDDTTGAHSSHNTAGSAGSEIAYSATSSSADDGQALGNRKGSLVAKLARELAGGQPDEDAITAIREHVGSPPVDRPSLDVRLQRVETELNQLAAYRTALEEFIDEHGRGRDLLEELQTNHEAISNTLTDVTTRLGEVDSRFSTLESQKQGLDELQATLTELDDRLTALESAHDKTDSRVDTTERQLDTVTRNIEDVESQVRNVASRHDSTVDELGSHLDQLDEAVETLTSRQQRVAGLFDDLSTSLADDPANDRRTETLADVAPRSID